MKKIKLLTKVISLFLIFILIGSCEKQYRELDYSADKKHLTSPNDSILKFASSEELFNTIEMLAALSPDEYFEWIVNSGFSNSYKVYFDALLTKLDSFNSKEELLNFISTKSSYIELSGDEVIPAEDYGLYKYIVNKDGYFYVKDQLYKVKGHTLYITKYGKEEIEKVLKNESTSSDLVEIVKLGHDSNCKGCSSTEGSAYATSGNRRVKIVLEIYEVGSYDGYTWTVRNYFSVTVYGYKRVLGIWFSYNTKYKYKDVSFYGRTIHESLYGKGTPTLMNESVSWPDSEKSPYDYTSYTWVDQVGETIDGWHPDYCDNPYFYNVDGKGTSRGLDYEIWATVDCDL